ncbi:DNA methyltransferase [Candidatus Puniceispirillum sp.]|uniref:DNA methyltransferase n=1 Tax=Candidatus Puniceispirillum sp. TaxID=2026719 RepID=UPI003F69C8EF
MNQLHLFERVDTVDAKLPEADFIGGLVKFKEFGKETEVISRNETHYFINEYWTSGQRQSHSIHEISYRACFKAQLPEFFIKRLTASGDAVHDPFMGRGTTPVQAALMGRQAFGNDINPLSVLLTRPRLHPISQKQIDETLLGLPINPKNDISEELLAFYHPETLAGLEGLKDLLLKLAPLSNLQPDPVIDWIRMVSINRLSGHSPGFFSGRSMPPNQAVSIKAQLKINEKLGLSPPVRDIKNIIGKKSKSLLRDGCVLSETKSRLFVGSAWNTSGIEDGSVKLVVTSPPFLDIVQYAADNWLRCWFAGIDPEQVKISMHKKAEEWTEMVHSVLAEMSRILCSGGHVAFEVGEVRNKSIFLEDLVLAAANGLPFEKLGVMVNQQDFTKTANCWGVDNGSKGTNTNRIVLLRRH